MSDVTRPWARWVAVAGPVVVILIAWATASIGDEADEGLALANVALLLALVTVAVALVSWVGGVATSVAAALALNWFHTEPTGTFRVESGADLVSVLLLAALGVGVSTVTALRVRAATLRGTAASGADVRRTLPDMVATPCAVGEVWHAALVAGSPELALVTSQLVPTIPDDMPRIAARSGAVDPGRSDIVLPVTGAAVSLRAPVGGYLILAPAAGLGAVTVDRRVVGAFADGLQAALERSNGPS